MKPGDVVYFKECKRTAHPRKGVRSTFKGSGFAVYLGEVKQFRGDVNPTHLLRLMGVAGFISFDDLASFIGVDIAEKCIREFERKYWDKAPQEAEAKEPSEENAAATMEAT